MAPGAGARARVAWAPATRSGRRSARRDRRARHHPATASGRDRARARGRGTFGLLTGKTWLAFWLTGEPDVCVTAGFAVGLVVGLATRLWCANNTINHAFCPHAVFILLRRMGCCPARRMDFLADARERGVLRTAGAVYRFRHTRLQDLLAGAKL